MKNPFILCLLSYEGLMYSLPLDFRLGVLSVVGVESVSAALHQHGECDSEHLNVVIRLICRSQLLDHSVIITLIWIFTASLRPVHVLAMCYCDCNLMLA